MRALVSLALVAVAVTTVGCGDDNSPTAMPTTAMVRVAHLSADAPNVDVWVNGSVALRNVPFSAVSDYLTLPAGAAQIQVTPAGASSPVVIDAAVTLDPGIAYTVGAIGLLGNGTLGAKVYVDDLRTVSGSAKVRLIHAVQDAPPVDVALAGGPVLIGNTGYSQASGYATVDGGTYNLDVRVAGTNTVALSLPGVALGAGTTYTAFAIGQLTNGSLEVRLVVDAKR